ncbi:MAG: hypothetical protein DMG80_00265 [Acidobacteria bacterium]|nr:MAG: hypothetical protein DMG80_00265 [Acidobacteriota bacterium]
MKPGLFDSSILATAQQAVEFVSNILESSTEYSVIGKDVDGKILLWNEGARRMYGYEAEEVVGKMNSEALHTPEDVVLGKPGEIMRAALKDGKWEGVLGRVRTGTTTRARPSVSCSFPKTFPRRCVLRRKRERPSSSTTPSLAIRKRRSISSPIFWSLPRSIRSSERILTGKSCCGMRAREDCMDTSPQKW